MNNIFTEKGTRDFGYTEIAETLLQNRLNNGTEESFYESIKQRLKDMSRYNEDDVNKWIEFLHKHLENGMDVFFKVDNIDGNNQGVILSQIPTETIYDMKLLDEMNIMSNGDCRDFEAYFIVNLKPDRNDNIELSEVTIVDGVGIERTVKLDNSIVIGYDNLNICENDYDGLEITYAKNTNKEITDISNGDIIGKIFEREQIVENIDFVNSSLAEYDFYITGYKQYGSLAEEKILVIGNFDVDNIDITLKDSNYQNMYKMLESALTELNSENNITPYQIIEKIDQNSKNENIEVKYTHLKRTGEISLNEISLNEVKDEYEKTDNSKDIEL